MTQTFMTNEDYDQLKNTEIPKAVTAALTEAKKNGDFDGLGIFEIEAGDIKIDPTDGSKFFWLYIEYTDQTGVRFKVPCGKDGQNEGASDPKYFDIDPDGLISLKPEYRGACPSSSYATLNPCSLSDNGVGKVGSKNDELPEKIVIPEVVDGTAVTGYQNGMFFCNMRIKEIVLLDTTTSLPSAFCWNAKYLETVRNTEQIEHIGDSCFKQTRLGKAIFPNLKELIYKSAFEACPHLHTVDIGETVTSIPKSTFKKCYKLSCVKGGENVTNIQDDAFTYTYNLRNLPMLDNGKITTLGLSAVAPSRVTFDWSKLENQGCNLSAVNGVYPTPVGDNPTDYWTGISFTSCKNKVVTLLHQKNPLWANEQVLDAVYNGEPQLYKSACSMFVMMHIYSAITGTLYTTPKEFEEVVRSVLTEDKTYIDASGVAHPLSDLLSTHTGLFSETTKYILQALVEHINSLGMYGQWETIVIEDDGITSDDLKTMYDGLANGGYVYAGVGTNTNVQGGHANMFYGVNEIGEMLVADSSLFGDSVDDYVGDTYRCPLQNITSTNNNFIVVQPVTE